MARVYRNIEIDDVEDEGLDDEIFEFILNSSCNYGFLLIEEVIKDTEHDKSKSKDNPLGLESCAFKGYDDPQEIEDFIEKFANYDKIFNGELKKVKGHVANKIKIYSKLTKKKREVKCLHSNGIKKIGKNLNEIYRSNDGMIEAFKGDNHRILGIMWHPERNKKVSNEDIKLFKECLKK